jgi:hypothetical protein
LEGWPDIMANVFDANTADNGPVFNNTKMFGSIYFIFFVLIGALFLMNLFVGVIFLQFSEEQKKEKEKEFGKVSEDQMKWIQMQDLIARATPEFDETAPPTNRARLSVFKLVTHPIFDAVIMTFIIANIITMGMIFEGMDTTYENVLKYINLFFTGMFIIEAILKIFGQGLQYFRSSWNLFDFTIVCVSIFDILMAIMGAKLLSFLRSGPQIARVLRVMRVSRLFKLMKTKALEGINKIIKTIQFAFPSLMNVLSLLVLLYFIFAVLGVFMFKGSPYEELVSNPEVNFDNFLNAFIVLFRCSTGEDWHRFMYHYSDSFSSPMLGRFYFLFYITLSSFIMLNMFTLVVTQQFEEFYFNTENPVTCFQDIAEEFRYAPHPIKIL